MNLEGMTAQDLLQLGKLYTSYPYLLEGMGDAWENFMWEQIDSLETAEEFLKWDKITLRHVNEIPGERPIHG